MSQSLVPFDDGSGWLSNRQLARAHRAQLSTDLAVFRHGLQAQAQAEMDRHDTQAIADASRGALDEELALLRDGLAQAGQSAAAIELVARKVELMASIDNRRIARRFGV
ncbi:MAG TPA: hypothetical protein VG147_07970 [Solirubrobacteraceae bacterium]|jgi:hypothetical protein|nr:hypothetical protein [Solirubrobacteraceae bacterium]